jgi:hypothetical protein
MQRFDIRSILANPLLRKTLFVRSIIAIQAREGIDTTKEQAVRAYEAAQIQKGN